VTDEALRHRVPLYSFNLGADPRAPARVQLVAGPCELTLPALVRAVREAVAAAAPVAVTAIPAAAAAAVAAAAEQVADGL
jgi:hypothetical protein